VNSKLFNKFKIEIKYRQLNHEGAIIIGWRFRADLTAAKRNVAKEGFLISPVID